jgi:aminoglycoside phosphotransferase (APT) family kinase protein
LSVSIPTPIRVGAPWGAFPWPWTISRWHDGLIAADVPIAVRAQVAADLARFVAEMHVPAPADAPVNPVRGVPLAHRDKAVRERLTRGAIARAARLRRVWDELVATPAWAGPPLWLHGDLHSGNLVLRAEPGAEPRLLAVIDFGDVTGGDPASDLAAAWLVFDAEARAAFRTEVDRLSPRDEDTWIRARGWALNLGTAFAAHSDDNPRMAAIGRHALDQVLLDG